MDKMLVVVFDSERQAYEGTRTLKDLHADGSITVYGQTVIAKDAGGKVTVKEATDEGPLGTAVGLVTGALVGVLGGPVGVAVGATAGAYGGALFDLTTVGVSEDFLDQVARSLEPGKAAVIAEVQEEWVLPVDTRMEDLGGTVFRRAWGDVLDAQIARDAAAIEADIAAMEAEYEQASGEARAKLRAKIDAAKADLQRVRDRAKAAAESSQREAEAKIAALKKQAADSGAERKQQLEQREAAIRADYSKRTAKLDQALELGKEADKLTMEALTP
jgi:uncharacterized membrane protein